MLIPRRVYNLAGFSMELNGTNQQTYVVFNRTLETYLLENKPKHPLFHPLKSSIVGIIGHQFLVEDQFGYVPRGTLEKSWSVPVRMLKQRVDFKKSE